MTIRITCPSCRASCTVEDGSAGKRIRCPRCEEVFTARPGGGGDRRDDDITERRLAPRGRAARDDEEAPRRRPSRDRDDDETPIRKRRPEKEGMSVGLLVGIGGGALLLVGLLVGGVVVAVSSSGKQATAIPTTIPVAANPLNPPEKDQPRPLPADLGPEALRRVKQSTVYLRVDLPGGGVAQGSGFFAVVPGVIITNAHVLGMLTADSPPPRSVAVILHHGEAEERELRGTVLGVDRTNDLAVLRTDANPASLPAPLQIEPAAKLTETQRVWVFGFPLGVQLGKNITVSPSAVTSLRKDAAGALSQVQVNGGMQPGNSGGPVANSRGEVVGVSVSIIQGTQLNFAIPGEFVTRVLAGGISDQEFGTPYVAGAGRIGLPVRIATLDPLQRIRKVEVDLWTGPAGEAMPAADKEPQPRPGDGPRQRVSAVARVGGFTADIPLPPVPPGQVYWSRPVVTDAAGVTAWAASRAVPFDPATVVERIPADLHFRVPTAPLQRTLHIAGDTSVKFFGGGATHVTSNKIDGYILEVSSPDTRGLGTGVRLHLAQPRFSRESGGKVVAASDNLSNFISLFTPTYLVLGNNSIREFGRPSFAALPPDSRETVAALFETVCNTWEATALPFPNRTLRPQESWPAHVPMLITAGGVNEARALNLTCTYEGTRRVNGVTLAHVLLAGSVNGTGPNANEVYGKAAGHALVNIDAKLLTQVKVTISNEVDLGRRGVRILATSESVIDRVDGNTRGIEIPEPVASRVAPPGWGFSIAKNRAFTAMFPDSAGRISVGTEAWQHAASPLRLDTIKAFARGPDGPHYAAWVVVVTPAGITGKDTPAGRLDWYRDREKGKDKVSREKPIAQGKAVGREFLIERPAAVSRYRVYTHLDKYYVTVVTGTKEQVDSKDANRFSMRT